MNAPAAGLARALPFVLLLVGLGGPRLQAQDAFPTGLSTSGLPGLVITPSVGAMPLGRFAVGVNNFPDFGVWWTRPDFTLGQQYNGYLAFNLFSRVDVSVRVSDRHAQEPRGIGTWGGPGGVLTFPNHHVDLSPNVQLIVAPESRGLPGLAVGAYDLTGTGLLEARYVVASRTLGSVARVSAGYGFGPDLLDGPFGGVEVRPTPWTTLKGEWDGDRVNAGIGLRPELSGTLGRYVSAPEVQATWAEDKGWYWSASLALPWDGDLAQAPRRPGRSAEAPTAWRTPSELMDGLVALGFENVRVSVSDSVVRVRYEDRVYLQNALDGLTRVLDLVARDEGGAGRRADVTLLSSERPVLRVSGSASALRSRWTGAAPEDELAVSYPASRAWEEAASWKVPTGRSSRWRADLILRPTLATHLAWEKGLADARVGIVPTLEVPLFAGLSAAVGYGFPLWQSEGMVVSRGPLPGASVETAALGYLWNRAMTSSSALALHWSAGRLNGQREGFRQQAALLLRGGRLRFDADLAATRAVGSHKVSGLGIVGARWLFPDGDTRLGVSTGRHLYEDWGWAVELSRCFGDTQLAFTVKDSEYGEQGVFTISLPLSGERSLRPGRLRPRMPSEWRHRQTSTLFTGGANWIAFNIGEGLPSSFEAWDRFLDRDRLHPAAAERALAGARFGGWR